MAKADKTPKKETKTKAKRDPGRDEMLSEYLASLGAIPLLTPEEEKSMAADLKEAEVLCWELVLSIPEGVDYLARHPAVDGNKKYTETEGLLVLTRAVAGKRVAKKRVVEARAAVALAMRSHDDDRKIIEEAIEVLGHSEITPRPGETAETRRKRTLEQDRERRRVMGELTRARRRALNVRNRFVRAHLRLVVSVARRFHHYRLPLIDLIQEGNLGLIKSVHRFDHTKGFRFSTYAHWWIRQAIERAIMNKGAQVRLPVHVFDARREVNKASRDLSQRLQREPTHEELAEALCMPLEKLGEILAAVPRDPVSLDDPIGDDEDRTLGETIAPKDQDTPDEHVITRTEAQIVRRVLGHLSPMEVDIIRRRFGIDHAGDETLEQIGKSYNLSRERVRQIQVQGLKKMERYCKKRMGLQAAASAS
jgi:RNA polymerase primary sigma factor